MPALYLQLGAHQLHRCRNGALHQAGNASSCEHHGQGGVAVRAEQPLCLLPRPAQLSDAVGWVWRHGRYSQPPREEARQAAAVAAAAAYAKVTAFIADVESKGESIPWNSAQPPSARMVERTQSTAPL